MARRVFHVELVKPSHYDDDGYVIQWFRASIPSNSLACLAGLTQDLIDRRALGDDVDLRLNAYDEAHTRIPVARIARRMRRPGHSGIVLLVGVQSNQFPRASDLARAFVAEGVPVAMGGFHVSGCTAMLPKLPDELTALQALGVALFAGEAEDGRLEVLLRDALEGRMAPFYDHLRDLPGLRGEVTPRFPRSVLDGYLGRWSAFDAGRGCPFQCSFCTIINVQGRKSRWRDADDVEALVREQHARGVRRFFITDDNFARNRNWEAIFDRLIELREKEDIRTKLLIQVDTLCHKIPRFVEKARRAGVRRVFIGLENVNEENLRSARKRQNQIDEYRAMLQAWRRQGILTIAGYILGFPADTPESIARDIETIQRELPIDILEFFVLTPLPGSADHRRLYDEGIPMDPDMNRYDLEHATTDHPKMGREELQAVYDRAWHLYYTPEHVETLLRRAEVMGPRSNRLAHEIFHFYGCYRFEKVHPLQGGAFRRKHRRGRRPGLPVEGRLSFAGGRAAELAEKYWRSGLYILWIRRLRRRIHRDPDRLVYRDTAIAPVAASSLTGSAARRAPASPA